MCRKQTKLTVISLSRGNTGVVTETSIPSHFFVGAQAESHQSRQSENTRLTNNCQFHDNCCELHHDGIADVGKSRRAVVKV
jgi:hypothetical protein